MLFVLGVCTEEAGRESGDGAGCKTFTLYAGASGMSGCWITGAEDVGRSFGSSENLLPPRVILDSSRCQERGNSLFTKQVTKPYDGICTVFSRVVVLLRYQYTVFGKDEGENSSRGEKILAVSSP